jgi:acetyl esterase/lipase
MMNRVLLLALFGALDIWAALPDRILIRADEMEGNWGPGMAFGAMGKARAANGTPLTKTVFLAPGDYRVYIRAVSSPAQRATYRVTVAGEQFATPPRGQNYRIGWIRVGRLRLPGGAVGIRVEDGTSDGVEVLDAVALSSADVHDGPGQALAFNEFILRAVESATKPLAAPRSKAEAQRKQGEMRRRLLRLAGLDPLPPRTPLNPVVTGRIEREGYSIEKVAFESRPRHVVPGLLYLPKDLSKPVPAVVGVIGHWNAGKSSLFPQERGIGLAKLGYAALHIDPSYAWERRIPGNSEGTDPYLSGGAINGHMAWDTMRAADYLLTRGEIDPERIALTGASGGGQQALYAGALDERFKVVAPAVYIWAFRDITAHWGYSPDNWLPGALLNGDMAATLALIAPRSLLVLSVTEDYVGIEGSKSQVEQARGFYRALGVPDRIAHAITPGEHGYDKSMREQLYGFLDKWLKGVNGSTPPKEPALDPLPEKAPGLLVFPSGRIPAEGAATVRSIWLDRARDLRAALPPRNPRLAATLSAEILRLPPARQPKARPSGEGLMLETEPGIEVPALLKGTGTQAVIWIGESGAASEAQSEAVANQARDRTVLVLEPRCLSMVADRGLGNQGAILLGRPLAGMWAFDIMRAVDYLRDQRKFRSISVSARGRHPALAALLATVLDRRIERALLEGLFPSFLDVLGRDPIAEIPGMLKVADVEQLIAAAGPGRVDLARRP